MGSSVHWEKEKVESFSRGTLNRRRGEERERERQVKGQKGERWTSRKLRFRGSSTTLPWGS